MLFSAAAASRPKRQVSPSTARPRAGRTRVAIPRLLERLELHGALVTNDAMGYQREIDEAIRAEGSRLPARPQGQLAGILLRR